MDQRIDNLEERPTDRNGALPETMAIASPSTPTMDGAGQADIEAVDRQNWIGGVDPGSLQYQGIYLDRCAFHCANADVSIQRTSTILLRF